MIGKTLGHYKIVEKIGAGGMGEVYRGRDERLRRDVAIKLLPEAFARDAERLARFEQEARLLASLNHSNIASIYGLEESDGVRFLVLELVEGPTLAERLAGGSLPVEEALGLCRQIAEALEAAHEKGIIHRDLKPANVKVTPEGKVKVLDFGLAKAFGGDAASADLTKSPTASYGNSRAGVILGTAAYMSPEQARGKPLDKRTDIWAFGCVLYEMLTGKQAFGGETVSDTIAKILEREPDWTRLPAAMPGSIIRLIRRCLEKDARQRLRDIGEARVAIEDWVAHPKLAKDEFAAGKMLALRRVRRGGPWAVAALFALIALFVGWIWKEVQSSGSRAVARVAIPLSSTEPVAMDTQRPAVAISPDGKRIAYVADRGGQWQLFLRELDQAVAQPIPGTEGGCGPFFSPDGRWLGFFDGVILKKISISGGAPLPIAVVPPVTRGASWAPDGTIYYTSNPNGGVSKIAGTGSRPEGRPRTRKSLELILTTPDPKKGENSHRWPEVLPGGQAILFTLDIGKSFDNARIAVLDLKSGQMKVLVGGGSNARYAASGHLIFARGNSLLAVPFDLGRLNVTGDPVTVVTNVATDPEGSAQFDFSDEGTLVYVSGSATSFNRRLVWVSRDGAVQPLPTPVREYIQPTLSHNGLRVAVTIPEGSNYDVWIADTQRGNLTRLTFDPGEDFNSVWTPDSKKVTISSELKGNGPQLFSFAADGSGTPERLIPRAPFMDVYYPGSYSPEGRVLVFGRFDQDQDVNSGTGIDIWVLPMDGKGEARALLESRYNEFFPTLSPDGRWLAYVSDETGREEVYVMAFPGPGGKLQISTEGGTEPIWHPSGRELFYRNGSKMMGVAVRASPTFTAERPRLLFEKSLVVTHRPEMRQNYDISPDGNRFLMIQNEREIKPVQIEVVLSWFEELKRRVPTGRK